MASERRPASMTCTASCAPSRGASTPSLGLRHSHVASFRSSPSPSASSEEHSCERHNRWNGVVSRANPKPRSGVGRGDSPGSPQGKRRVEWEVECRVGRGKTGWQEDSMHPTLVWCMNRFRHGNQSVLGNGWWNETTECRPRRTVRKGGRSRLRPRVLSHGSVDVKSLPWIQGNLVVLWTVIRNVRATAQEGCVCLHPLLGYHAGKNGLHGISGSIAKEEPAIAARQPRLGPQATEEVSNRLKRTTVRLHRICQTSVRSSKQNHQSGGRRTWTSL